MQNVGVGPHRRLSPGARGVVSLGSRDQVWNNSRLLHPSLPQPVVEFL